MIPDHPGKVHAYLKQIGLPMGRVVLNQAGTAYETVSAVVVVDPATGGGIGQGLTSAQLDATIVKTEPLGILGKAHEITAGATASTSLALTSTTTRLRIYARGANVRIAIGTGSQAATTTTGTNTSHFVAADTGMDVACPAGSSISVMRNADQTVNGTVYVSELL
jgi:hypothetical protein